MATKPNYWGRGSGFGLNKGAIEAEAVQYAKDRAKAEGGPYLQGNQTEYYKGKEHELRVEYGQARARRGKRDPLAKMDITDQLLQQIALADYNRKPTGRNRMSTFLGNGPLGQTAPNLATATLLGSY